MSGDSSNAALPPVAPAAKPQASAWAKLPWGPAFGFFVTATAFVASQVVAGLLFVVGLNLAGWSSGHVNNWLNGVVGQFIVVSLSEILALAVLWLFLRARKIDWRLLGYKRWPIWKDVGRSVLAFVIYFTLLTVAAGLASAIFHIDLNQKQDIGFQSVVGAGQKLMTFITLVLLPPIVEETLFRGLLFGGFRKKLPWVWAAVFTSLLFAVPHMFETSHGLLWIGGIDTFILSMVVCYLREKTGALWAGIGVHMLKNTVAFLFLYIFVTK